MLRRTLLVTSIATLVAAAPAAAAPVGTPTVVTAGIPTPWEVVPMPDGRTLVTSFNSTVNSNPNTPQVRVIEANDTLRAAPAYVETAAGLRPRKFLGLVRSPTIENRLYLYETLTAGSAHRSRILSLTYDPAKGTLAKSGVIFDRGIASDLNHDGGRMVFGPDGQLYVTTGDVHRQELPQDRTKLNGKVLRMQESGAPSVGNPDNEADGTPENDDYVFSYGHRHPQGLAFVGADLWETEHGPTGRESYAPAGAKTGHDEVNLLQAGGNFGWTSSAGDTVEPGTIAPKVHSGAAPAWAPADLEFAPVDGLLYMPALNGRHLRVFELSGTTITRQGAVFGQDCFGRMRSAVVDGSDLWLTTDEATERVLRVSLAAGDAGISWTPQNQYESANGCPALPPPPLNVIPDPPSDEPGNDEPPPPASQSPVALPSSPLTPPVTPALPPAPDPAPIVRTSVDSVGVELRRLGLQRILRRGTIAARLTGLRGGSASLLVELRRPGRSALTVARGGALPPGSVRGRLTRSARRALQRATRARLRIRLTYTPPAGAPVTRTRTVTVSRAGKTS